MKNQGINHLKIEQLKAQTLATILFENDVVKYLQPVSYQTLQKTLHFEDAQAKKILLKLNLSYRTDQLMSEKDFENFLLELGFDVEKIKPPTWYDSFQEFLFHNPKPNYQTRSLIVTMMGHVDHGKTTLLDVICKSNLTKKEAGQITQKVGGYQIEYQKQSLTFIDTPGHNLFSQMRQRGVNITDVVVLVVSATEGVKTQTIEAIKYAQAAKVPIIVFINKVDLPQANFDNVVNQVSKYGLSSKKWGGKTPYISGSCLKKTGIDELLKTILQFGTDLNLKTDFSSLAKAIIIDSYVDKQGIKASIILQKGTLKIGDKFFINGIASKVKALIDHRNRNLKLITPGMCAVILGLTETSQPSSYLYQFLNDKFLNTLVKDFNLEKTTVIKTNQLPNRQDFMRQLFESESTEETPKTLNLILKVDSKATEEVLNQQITVWEKANEKAKLKLKFLKISSGNLTLNDINLAKLSQAQIITFNLKIPTEILNKINEENVKFKKFLLLYELFDYLTEIQIGKIFKEYEEKIFGEAKILKVFDHSKFGKIAGGVVLKGTIKVSHKDLFKIVRENEEIAKDLKIKSLQQKKNTLQTVTQNQEFGIIFYKKVDFLPGDIIFQYQLLKINE